MKPETATAGCEHLAQASAIAPASTRCEACVALGTSWTELRVCVACGHVGCCEDSPHAHALAHHQATGHPIIVPLDRKQKWAWCYLHHRYFHGTADSLRPPQRGVGARLRAWVRGTSRR